MTARSVEDTLTELSQLSQYFFQAETAIKDGQMVDMAGIEGRINDLCQIVQNAIPEQQKIYLPELTILLSRLDSCEASIRMMQADLASKASREEGSEHA